MMETAKLRFGAIGNEVAVRVPLDLLPDRDAIQMLYVLIQRFKPTPPEGDEENAEWDEWSKAADLVLRHADKNW